MADEGFPAFRINPGKFDFEVAEDFGLRLCVAVLVIKVVVLSGKGCVLYFRNKQEPQLVHRRTDDTENLVTGHVLVRIAGLVLRQSYDRLLQFKQFL